MLCVKVCKGKNESRSTAEGLFAWAGVVAVRSEKWSDWKRVLNGKLIDLLMDGMWVMKEKTKDGSEGSAWSNWVNDSITE
jgi:hypothetical protein